MARAPRKLDALAFAAKSYLEQVGYVSASPVRVAPLDPSPQGEGDDGTDNVVRQTQKLDRTGPPTNMLVEPGKPSN